MSCFYACHAPVQGEIPFIRGQYHGCILIHLKNPGVVTICSARHNKIPSAHTFGLDLALLNVLNFMATNSLIHEIIVTRLTTQIT